LKNACVSGVEEALTELLREGSLSLRDMMRMLPSVIVSCISQEVVEFLSGTQFTLEELEDDSDLKPFMQWLKSKKEILKTCCICTGKF
jgi:hypothetical protein